MKAWLIGAVAVPAGMWFLGWLWPEAVAWAIKKVIPRLQKGCFWVADWAARQFPKDHGEKFLDALQIASADGFIASNVALDKNDPHPGEWIERLEERLGRPLKVLVVIGLAGLCLSGCVTMSRQTPVMEDGKVIGFEGVTARKWIAPLADSKDKILYEQTWVDSEGCEHRETFSAEADTQAAAGMAAAVSSLGSMAATGLELALKQPVGAVQAIAGAISGAFRRGPEGEAGP